ncbi:unnamed protein product [Owenia fusiformis]|uniref:Palmitoyltransferase n=1 Tax=Owenia fusiformis TaxID=6347 RepID=A0A8S4NYM0_OWEFU|nr:unnamed protein product [Owenia fusiformis]
MKKHLATAVFVRVSHTALTLGVPATLLVKKTELRSALIDGENLLYGVLYVILLLTSLTFYHIACAVDPGYVPDTYKVIANNDDSDDEDDLNDDDSEHGKMVKTKPRYCDYCEIDQPMRSRHCEDCGHCVRKFDHHCPWLETCVGERNHKIFWLFLLTKVAVIGWTLLIIFNAIVYKAAWNEWGYSNVLYIIDSLILVISGLVVIGLWGFHTYIMGTNITTWEMVSRRRITYLKYLDEDFNPFHEGYIKNILYFLCVCNERNWEIVYRKNVKMENSYQMV